MQEVSGSIPLTSTREMSSWLSPQVMTLSSRGLGHHPFTVSTGVRIPVGSPSFVALGLVAKATEQKLQLPGVVVQLVRIPACHAGGRGFESRPLRQNEKPLQALVCKGFFFLARRLVRGFHVFVAYAN